MPTAALGVAMRLSLGCPSFLAALSIACIAGAAGAAVMNSAPFASLVPSAERIFRGSCVAANPVVVHVAGARIPATEYTFQVSDPIAGCATGNLVFRQVGRPGGGPMDLGALVGLPTYVPGREYVLLLVPPSRAGLCSPAGAGAGAFQIVAGDRVVALRAGVAATAEAEVGPAAHVTSTGTALTSVVVPDRYDALRRALRGGGR